MPPLPSRPALPESRPSPTRSRAPAEPHPLDHLQTVVSQALHTTAERLQSLDLTHTAATLLENGRQDLITLSEAHTRAYGGLQTIVSRQRQWLRDSLKPWEDRAPTQLRHAPSAQLAPMRRPGRTAFQQAWTDMRELADVAAQARATTLGVVRKRLAESLVEAAKRLNPTDSKK